MHDPNEFVRDIVYYLEQLTDSLSVMSLECIKVRYDKGQYINKLPKPSISEVVAMSYRQKDRVFLVNVNIALF